MITIPYTVNAQENDEQYGYCFGNEGSGNTYYFTGIYPLSSQIDRDHVSDANLQFAQFVSSNYDENIESFWSFTCYAEDTLYRAEGAIDRWINVNDMDAIKTGWMYGAYAGLPELAEGRRLQAERERAATRATNADATARRVELLSRARALRALGCPSTWVSCQ